MVKPVVVMAKEYVARLPNSLLNSPAYLDLKPPARALLVEFLRIYRPSRNGELSISLRTATERLNVTEPVAMNAFVELAEHGFIRLRNLESWQERKARQWELTMHKVGNREAWNDWMQWQPGANLCPLPPKKKKARPMKTGAVLPMKARAVCQ
ncbi:hypothetical protein [Thiothrix nivea]|uniref:Uncharacterized protein n=1 Tax=Thiothrix nivea (strain ATCC 35100 / DSM 5205 / JP2) TaxID=870187 RepID=A0A656HEV1_THINJ|nr:hypothetical protein [Thiothrix nivea]EIJ34524.1 hypothetical protein Thini_1948 [Thiothrix nivea DSM 5205]